MQTESKFLVPYEYRRHGRTSRFVESAAVVATCKSGNDDADLNRFFSVFVNALATNPP
jgi:hypothetical protein